jgi:hypothetical protein
MSIKYYECVCTLGLVIRHANRIFSAPHYNYCHLWPVWLFHVFPIVSQMTRFSREGGGSKDIEHNMCFDFLCEFCLKYFSF